MTDEWRESVGEDCGCRTRTGRAGQARPSPGSGSNTRTRWITARSAGPASRPRFTLTTALVFDGLPLRGRRPRRAPAPGSRTRDSEAATGYNRSRPERSEDSSGTLASQPARRRTGRASAGRLFPVAVVRQSPRRRVRPPGRESRTATENLGPKAGSGRDAWTAEHRGRRAAENATIPGKGRRPARQRSGVEWSVVAVGARNESFGRTRLRARDE
jgi:hypothetical protein